MKNHPFSVIIPYPMMKKKPHLLFLAASPSSLSTIGAISEIRSLSNIVPSSLSNNQSPPPPSAAPSPSLFTIREIREIRSLSNTLPSFGGVGGGPPLSSVSSLYVFTIRAISEIRSLVSISAF